MTVVEALLKHGANPNLVREDGCSPLIIASQMGHENVVKALLHPDNFDNSYKTDITIRTVNDYDAISVAASNSIFELLQNHALDSQVYII